MQVLLYKYGLFPVLQEVQVDGIPAHVLQRELHDTQITAWVVVSSRIACITI